MCVTSHFYAFPERENIFYTSACPVFPFPLPISLLILAGFPPSIDRHLGVHKYTYLSVPLLHCYDERIFFSSMLFTYFSACSCMNSHPQVCMFFLTLCHNNRLFFSSTFFCVLIFHMQASQSLVPTMTCHQSFMIAVYTPCLFLRTYDLHISSYWWFLSSYT